MASVMVTAHCDSRSGLHGQDSLQQRVSTNTTVHFPTLPQHIPAWIAESQAVCLKSLSEAGHFEFACLYLTIPFLCYVSHS